MRPKVVIIVQARMGSSRLPGKVLAEVNGRPLLDYLLQRLQRCRLADKVVVATTTAEADNAINTLSRYSGVACFRGSEDDVLARYAHCAQQHNADIVVRITADCPLSDPALIDQLIRMFLLHNALPTNSEDYCKYASNCKPRTFPQGFDIEVFTNTVLQRAHQDDTTPYDREHVTPWIIQRSQPLRLCSPVDYSHLRCTVDYPQDFDVVSHILQSLKPGFTWRNVADLLTEKYQPNQP